MTIIEAEKKEIKKQDTNTLYPSALKGKFPEF